MNFLKIIPMSEVDQKEVFASCSNLHEFFKTVTSLSFCVDDLRSQQALLAVYMAFRDHYPSYLENLDAAIIAKLNQLVAESDPKIIKLRRIALAELSKVA